MDQLWITLIGVLSGGTSLKLLEIGLNRFLDRPKERSDQQMKTREMTNKEYDGFVDQLQEQLGIYERQIERWEKQNQSLEERVVSQRQRHYEQIAELEIRVNKLDAELSIKNKALITLEEELDMLRRTYRNAQAQIVEFKQQLEPILAKVQEQPPPSSHSY